MTKFTSWTKSEICKLFAMVSDCKKHKKPVLQAFKNFASSFGRKPLSVRNFYYSELRFFEKNPTIAKNWGIDLASHKKLAVTFFSEEELKDSMSQIENLKNSGQSVRSACQTLANGDVSKMLRLQNKWRSVNKKPTAQLAASNVLVMPTKHTSLSESEINSLVLGLVRLVKKSAEECAEQSYDTLLKTANFELRKSIKLLGDKEREYETLRKNFEILTTNNQKLTEEIQLLRSQNVELKSIHLPTKKMSGLKTYIKKLHEPLVKT